jgi:hypothetical protein
VRQVPRAGDARGSIGTASRHALPHPADRFQERSRGGEAAGCTLQILALPQSGSRTILKLTVWVRGTNPSTLEIPSTSFGEIRPSLKPTPQNPKTGPKPRGWRRKTIRSSISPQPLNPETLTPKPQTPNPKPKSRWTETDSDSEFDFVWADVPWMREHFDGSYPPPCFLALSQSIWTNQSGAAGLFSAPKLTGLYRRSSMSTWE